MAHSHSAEEIRLIKADLDQLRAFERSDIVTPLVKRELEAVIHRVEDLLNHEEKDHSATAHRPAVHIDLYYESGSGMHPLGRVDVNTPISHLKALLVNKSSSFQNSERVRVERTGRVLSLGLTASVADSGLCTGDVLFPEYPRPRGQAETVSASASDMDLSNADMRDAREHFYRLVVSSGCFPQSPFEAVVVAAHYYLLSCTDLVCLSATPNSVRGFAPSVRELPRHQFLPPKWNDSQHAVILNYRSKSTPKLTFKCECYLELDSTSVAFGYKDAPREGEVHNQASLALNSIDVALAEYINTHSPAFLSMSKTKQEFQSIFENEDGLFDNFPDLLSGFEFLLKSSDDVAAMKHSPLLSEEHLPGISGGSGHKGGPPVSALCDADSLVKVDTKNINSIGMPSPAGSGSSDSSLGGQQHYLRRPASPLTPITPLHAIPPTSGDWKNEGPRGSPADLPWASASPSKHHGRTSVGADDLFPNPHHGIASLEPLHPGGGMLMGPGHPVFHQGEHGGLDLFHGGGIRDARHDPIVPPVSGGTGLEPDMFGGDLHARPPKGKHKAKLQPGEPNPDHFRPPSWNNGSGFI